MPYNFPTELSLQNFLSDLDGNHSVLKGCRFLARVNIPVGLSSIATSRDLIYACDSAEFPGRGFAVTESRYYGPRQLVPSNTLYGDGITLSFICRSKTLERKFFDDWMDYINPITSFHFRYPSEYYTTIDVVQYAEFGDIISGNLKPKPLYAWQLLKAWPTLVQPQQVTWADTDILRLQVTFAYKRWVRTLTQ